jgi:hypothetical protein
VSPVNKPHFQGGVRAQLHIGKPAAALFFCPAVSPYPSDFQSSDLRARQGHFFFTFSTFFFDALTGLACCRERRSSVLLAGSAGWTGLFDNMLPLPPSDLKHKSACVSQSSYVCA